MLVEQARLRQGAGEPIETKLDRIDARLQAIEARLGAGRGGAQDGG
jgi:hypothetical protein